MNFADSFDIDGEFTLGALYSMEQEGIPVLTELMSNSGKLSSMIGATEINQQEELFKWPTFQVPTYDKPTWKKLRSILKFLDEENLAEAIKSYLKIKNGATSSLSLSYSLSLLLSLSLTLSLSLSVCVDEVYIVKREVAKL